MDKEEIKIRKATKEEFQKLYVLGKKTPELKVSQIEDFMDSEEFLWAIENPDSIFLLAEINSDIVGFMYTKVKPAGPESLKKWACLVYVSVDPKYRKKGISTKLYNQTLEELKKTEVTNLYAWANIESDGAAVEFLKNQGFDEGHKYMWMDKKI